MVSLFVSIPSTCPFFHQFAPEPVEGPFDGGGLPILVVGNHDDTTTSFSDSEEVATEVLSNGYLVETSHYKHVVYPQNECVNNHVHRALIDGLYPNERRVFCEREDWEVGRIRPLVWGLAALVLALVLALPIVVFWIVKRRGRRRSPQH